MLRHCATALIACLALTIAAGCTREAGVASRAQLNAAPAAKAVNKAAGSRYLAYEHWIRLDAEEAKIAVIFEAAQAACRQATEDACVVLESRLQTGREVSASLKLRAKPSGVKKLIAALSQQAQLSDQSTSAEDLEAPITDTAKQLAMRNDYRQKLEALRESAKNDVDALIKVNKELAQVQSELEAMSGKHARLLRRVETEILNVSIESAQRLAFWRPIGLSLSDFGSDLSRGVSIAITGVAYLIPWALLLGFALWLGRKLWRRRRPRANL